MSGMGDCTWWLGSDKCFLHEGHTGEHNTKWASDFVTISFREGGAGVRQWPPAARPHRDPDPCLMRPDQPHVCLRPDHDERHGKTTPKQPS